MFFVPFLSIDRWKDAVARAEALQAEAHESTAPLLRQVTSDPSVNLCVVVVLLFFLGPVSC